jgi:predicted metalloendopeptidase
MRRTRISTTAAAILLAAAVARSAGKNESAVDRAKMDPSADRCKDFYQWADGGWLAANPIPPDRSSWGAGSELSQSNLLKLQDIAEKAAADSGVSSSSIEGKVGAYYRTGMDEKKVDADGLAPLAAEIARIDAIRDADGLAAEIARLHRIGVSAGFTFVVLQDFKNSSVNQAWLYQGGLGLPDREYYLSDDPKQKEIRAGYTPHVKAILALGGDSADTAVGDSSKILAFETRLAKASMTPVEQRDPNAIYHPMDLAALIRLAPGFPWKVYFSGIGLAEPGTVNVGQPEFFKEVSRLTTGVSLPEWKSYLRWQLLHAEADRLPAPFVDENFRFFGKVVTGATELRPRWKRIVQSADQEIGEALGQLYVEKYFPPEAKRRARAMVDNLIAALRDRLTQIDWVGPETRRAALAKLDAIAVKVGYPDRWRDYSKLALDAGTFAGNVLQAEAFEFDRNLAKIGRPVDRAEWGITTPTVDAYYNPSFNEIVFPAGILQPPFFDPQADDAVNYGAIGMVIGHELTHGFDDQGHQFDAQGNLKPWWTPEDEKRYAARAATVERQFSAYVPIENLHINGKLTLGENIADLGGLKIAYLAFHKALAAHPVPAETDGFTPDQRFFVAYAQGWRRNQRPENIRLMIATDPHSPARFRVIGPVSNMPEFAKAFGCAAPPESRAEIW